MLAYALTLSLLSSLGAEPVDFTRDVKPILVARCVQCHGGQKQEAKLRLTTLQALKQGGENGSIIEIGNASKSRLIRALQGTHDLTRMPPESSPLNRDQINTIAQWIDEGAHGDEAGVHWSFVPPKRRTPPRDPKADPTRHPIDDWVRAKLKEKGLSSTGAADKATLLRRVTLDLTGVPPTREEWHAFELDTAPDAYERVVDRLLASPHHGERWGRHWMDVWRYSDWSGFGEEVRVSQRHIWRWRDWIIESINRDKPYDRMIMEMLAADEIAPTDADALRATGFLARNWFRYNRNVWLMEAVEHTSKAFLGVTMHCARCHDHVYDPITQENYYEWRSFFEPHQVRADRVAGQADPNKDGLPRVFDQDKFDPTYLFERGDDSRPRKDRPLTPAWPTFLRDCAQSISPVSLPPSAYYPALSSLHQDSERRRASAELARADDALARAKAKRRSAESLEARYADPAGRPRVLWSDDFSSASTRRQTEGGAWKTADGVIAPSTPLAKQSRLRASFEQPRDLSVSLRFRITGGKTFRSVGISVDAKDEEWSTFAYVSAGGKKLQVGWRRDGADLYPPSASVPVDAPIGQWMTLRFDLRDRLVNVALDGRVLLAYRLPIDRRPGQVFLWTHDGTAEFDEARAIELPVDAVLHEAVAKDSIVSAHPLGLEDARRESEQANLAVERAFAHQRYRLADKERIDAVIAADNARYRDATIAPERKASLVSAALAAQRLANLRNAEADVRAKELDLAIASRDHKDEGKRQEALKKARQALAAALAEMDQPTGDYQPLGILYPKSSTGRRSALARSIVDRRNPLTARVAVNHVWMRHFGQPLVASVFDFGAHGEKPSHPELLDWLAVELMESGWSLKRLHRQIVLSDTYRTSSSLAGKEAEQAADPENRWLWRYKPHRLEAEAVRDSVLSAAGELDQNMGGPELDHLAGESTRRRSVYYRQAAEKQMPLLLAFDAPSVNECYRRAETIVPQQGLALANSKLVLSASRRLARRLGERLPIEGAQAADFVQSAFETVLCRAPTNEELLECVHYLAEQERIGIPKEGERAADTYLGEAVDPPPAKIPSLRARENLVHVLLNHHDFVTCP